MIYSFYCYESLHIFYLPSNKVQCEDQIKVYPATAKKTNRSIDVKWALKMEEIDLCSDTFYTAKLCLSNTLTIETYTF